MPIAFFPHLKYWWCGHCSTPNEPASPLMPRCLLPSLGFPTIWISILYSCPIFRLLARPPAPLCFAATTPAFSLFQWQGNANQPRLDNLSWPVLPFPPCLVVLLSDCCSKVSHTRWVRLYGLLLQSTLPFLRLNDSPFVSAHKIGPISVGGEPGITTFPLEWPMPFSASHWYTGLMIVLMFSV